LLISATPEQQGKREDSESHSRVDVAVLPGDTQLPNKGLSGQCHLLEGSSCLEMYIFTAG
jgi:hypothetical protein